MYEEINAVFATDNDTKIISGERLEICLTRNDPYLYSNTEVMTSSTSQCCLHISRKGKHL